MAPSSQPPSLLCFFLLLSISHFSTFISAQFDTYIIHMDLSAMPKIFPDHHSWYSATLSSISEDPFQIDVSAAATSTITDSKLIYTYTSVIHGFCAKLFPSELEALENSPGFVSSIQDVPGKAHTTRSTKFLGLNPKSGAWPKSNYGKGVIIGFLDSGVWPESKSYRDDGMPEIPSKWKGKCVSDIAFNSSMCNKKLIGVQSFNKGIIAHKPDIKISLNSSRDNQGHGAHTSTTAAGNFVENASLFGYAEGSAQGTAPLAHIAMYKVLWEDDVYSSDILAAVDQAIEDGVDILSISLAYGENPLYKDPLAIASFAATERGIFVTTSAGNDGPQYWSVNSGIPWALSVGASSLDREVGAIVRLENGVSIFGASLYLGNSSLNQVPLVYVKDCDVDRVGKIGYKIVVCETEDYEVSDRVYDVGAAQVAGGIFIMSSSHLESLIDTKYPAAFLNPEDGELVLNYINKSSNPRARVEFRKTRVGSKPAPVVGDYSSRGPSPTTSVILKPDLIAPGTLVLAAWPETTSVVWYQEDMFNPFNMLWGTSMACPHVAGVAALLKGAHPEWSPAAIRSALMTTADLLDNTGKPIKDFGDNLDPANPLAMGAGHINPNKALNPGLIYETGTDDYVRFLCSLNFTKKQIKTITRSSHLNCLNYSKPESSDLNYPSFIAFFNADSSSPYPKITQVFRRTVTNVGEAVSNYTAKLTDMGEVHVSLEPKTLVFTEKNQKLSYTLTLEGPSRVKEQVIHGSLTWVGNDGKYVVKSPIVATNLDVDDRGD